MQQTQNYYIQNGARGKNHQKLKPLLLQCFSTMKTENYRVEPATINLNPTTAHKTQQLH